MKILMLLMLSAALAWTAEITIVIKNDAGVVVTTITIKTTDKVLDAVELFRLNEKVSQPPVLRFPTASDMWREVLISFVKAVDPKYHTAILAEQAKIDAAAAAIEKIKSGAVQ